MGFTGRFGSGRKAFMGHQIGVVVVFGGCDLRCKNSHGCKEQNQGKSDNGRRVPENAVQCKF
jgi:pyruvate-formate lyase-activating enzyme